MFADISDVGFRKAVKELPLLEELEFTHLDLSKKAIEAAAHFCPSLKSFSFTRRNLFREPSDEDALAVAYNMHGLKHLALVRNDMTDEGVNAILDACPLLQSLNLEDCSFVRLHGGLRLRCSQQIEDMKHSPDPYVFN